MRAVYALGISIAGLLLAASVWAARPVAVSPGSTQGVTTIEQRCPSFSWGAVEGARGYELVVYGLREGAEAGLKGTEPRLRERLPGGALSWTPSMERCLVPGGRYAWLVRSLGEEGRSDWSEPRLFEVAARPSPAEVEQALAVLRSYLAAGGLELEKGWEPGALAAKPEAGERREASRAPSGVGIESPGGPEGVLLPDVTGVKAQVPDPSGVTFGLYGISASTDDNSAGVVGESTATSGATFGVLGEVDSAAGVAGAFDNTAGGKVLSGRNNAVEVFSVDGAGDVTVSGLVDGVDVSAHAADANAHHTPPTSLPPSGPAGGDLAGTFPNPDVVDDSHAHTNATVADNLSINNGRLFAPAGAGNVGIGTITPAQPLDVNGNMNLGGNLFKAGTLFLHDNGTNNIAVGQQALSSNTSGSRNTASGFQALAANTTGADNTASGYQALFLNTGGSRNTAFGDRALRNNTTGTRNTATGSYALRNNTTGSLNTAHGERALAANTTGSYNTASGERALNANTTGYNNTASGYGALRSNTTGFDNTGSGAYALFSNTTGANNTATGFDALRANTIGNFNNASGDRALQANTTGSYNTASGAEALRSNTTGSNNTASGYAALSANTTGNFNTAHGYRALFSNTSGSKNTASGYHALSSNTAGTYNTASGFFALRSNSTGHRNTATGYRALRSNTTGFLNTASGHQALYFNTTGANNTATGFDALRANTTGYRNVALGYKAGFNATTGSDNIFLGSGAEGVGGEGNTIRIGGTTVGTGVGEQDRAFINGVRGVTTGVADAIPVLIDSAGQLGTVSSSRRFKKEIEEMGEASDQLLELRPVTFRYKQEPVEGTQPLQFGLIAEEVAEVLPDLVVYDEEGKPYTVRYHLLSSMLLNELQKQHRQLADQRQSIERLIGRLARLEAVEAKRPGAAGSRHPPPADRTGAP